MVNWDSIGSEGNAKKTKRGTGWGGDEEVGGDSSGRNKMDGSGLKGGGTGGGRMVEDSSGRDKGHTGEGGEDGAKAKKGSTQGQSMEAVGNFMPVQSLIADGYQTVDRWGSIPQRTLCWEDWKPRLA